MKSFIDKMNKHDRKSLLTLFVQFLKFGIVGLSNTVISLGIYYLFIWMNPNLYIVGNVVGFIVSVANAFFWSNRYVFKDSNVSFFKGLFKSYIAYGGSFLVATGLLYIQVEWLHISKIYAPIINLVVTIPVNFLVNKYWTFK